MSASQKRDVEAELAKAGWRVVAREMPATDPWWIDEQWRLESDWSPRTAQAFVTFLVDPQASQTRKSGEEVWAVAITLLRPKSDAEAKPVVPLGPRWESRNLKELERHIHALRTSNPDDAGQQQDEADEARDR